MRNETHLSRKRQSQGSPTTKYNRPKLVTEDITLQVLRILKENPRISQRELAKALGISLGKVNYCVRALIEKGWIKTNHFKTSKNKLAYAYLLTPEGLKQKSGLQSAF